MLLTLSRSKLSTFVRFSTRHTNCKMANIPKITFSNGVTCPILGLGTWKSKPGEVENAVKCAIDAGYRLIDCAYVYGNEAEVGAGIAAKIADGTVKREDLFVISKLWNCHHRPDIVRKAVEKSLKNMQLDYLDLYFIHWPMAFKADEAVNYDRDINFPKDAEGNVIYENIDFIDTYKALEECHAAGLVKNLGVSNFNSKQVQRILDECSVKLLSNQVEVNPYLSQEKLDKFCQERGVYLMAYSPLGSPDRPWASPDEPTILEDPKLKELATKHGKSPAQIILRWLTQRNVIVIPKSVTPSRIKENIDIFNFELSAEDMKVMSSLNRDWRTIVPMVTVNGKRVWRDRNAPHFPFHEEF